MLISKEVDVFVGNLRSWIKTFPFSVLCAADELFFVIWQVFLLLSLTCDINGANKIVETPVGMMQVETDNGVWINELIFLLITFKFTDSHPRISYLRLDYLLFSDSL